MAKRKAIGNAARFKIFARDSFRCQYCGRTPPAVRLHVDHVLPVAKGGTNEDENLVTSCSDCNHGKHTRKLERGQVPQDFAAMAEDAGERAKQLAAYRKGLAALRAELDSSIDLVGNAFWGKGLTFSYSDGKNRGQVERFMDLLGLAEVETAARIARAKFPDERAVTQRLKYFCGVVWTRCTELGIRGDDHA